MYVATDFGYVVIDDKKFVIKESHVYRTRLTSVAQLGDMLLVSTPEASYYGDADEYYEQLEAFEPASFYAGSRLWPISDSTFFCMGDSTVWSKMSFDNEGVAKFSSDTIITNRTTVVQKTKGGYLLNVPNLKKCYKTDETGLNLVGTDTDGELCSANPEGDGSFWAAGVNGLHQMVESESYFMPNSFTIRENQCTIIEKKGIRRRSAEPVPVTGEVTVKCLRPGNKYHVRYESQVTSTWATFTLDTASATPKRVPLNI